jgi:hypothetical protein
LARVEEEIEAEEYMIVYTCLLQLKISVDRQLLEKQHCVMSEASDVKLSAHVQVPSSGELKHHSRNGRNNKQVN